MLPLPAPRPLDSISQSNLQLSLPERDHDRQLPPIQTPIGHHNLLPEILQQGQQQLNQGPVLLEPENNESVHVQLERAASFVRL